MNNGDAVVRYDQLADRWLIVMPIFRRARSQARPARGVDARRAARTSARPARAGSARASRRCSCRRPTAAGRRAAGPRRGGRASAAAGPGPLLDVLRRQHRAGPVRAVLPLRVPAAAVPRLPAAGRLARRLLRADEHRRRRDPEARVRRGPGPDAARGAGHRAVRRDRRRELPQQRGPGRQDPAARGRPERDDGSRRHAAAEAVRRRPTWTRGSSTSTGTTRRRPR